MTVIGTVKPTPDWTRRTENAKLVQESDTEKFPLEFAIDPAEINALLPHAKAIDIRFPEPALTLTCKLPLAAGATERWTGGRGLQTVVREV